MAVQTAALMFALPAVSVIVPYAFAMSAVPSEWFATFAAVTWSSPIFAVVIAPSTMFAVATPFAPVASWLPVIPAEAAMSAVVIVASTMLLLATPFAPVAIFAPVT